jgi:type VI secretion system secreted protein VgrG
MRPGIYAQTDYNFEQPSQPLTANVSGKNKYEIYDYHPGEYRKHPEGDGLVRTRLQELETPCMVAYGSSDCRAFVSGYRFDLKEHYRDDMNQAWVLTSLRHSASQPGDFQSSSASKAEFYYRNSFECIPLSTPFRPARVTPHPVVQGSQTAVVVGPAGEEIFTDKYGRVKVQFHWDREGKNDEKSSCWIRVAQAWAGKKWGAMFIPRIGQEVIVDFLEGDPDQPIITGRVYNAEQIPPYQLPDEKTKSTIKSLSSKGGDGFNEIRFEDQKGSEQVFVHAEKDMDVRVKNDRREWIGEDRSLILKRDRYEQVDFDVHVETKRDHLEKIGRDRSMKVAGKQAVEIMGSKSLKVGDAVTEEFGANHSEKTTGDYYLHARNIVIEADIGLTINVGSNFITIDKTGVSVVGTPLINLNSGGMALAGVPGVLAPATAPGGAAEADTGQPGSMIQHERAAGPASKFDSDSVAVGASSASAGAGSEPAPRHDPDSPENRDKQHFIAIELLDDENQPVAGEPYEVVLPDGSTVASGTTDENGKARVGNIDPGQCTVRFPRIDQSALESL